MPVSDNRRIINNTLALYVRQIITVIISLYTSRVILQVLGVDNYGIYNLVGGVVVLFTVLSASMNGATSRFLAYELGKGDKKRLEDTFSTAFIVHCILALVIFVLSETVGLWFLTYKLVIPPERMFAAHVVFQLSVLSTMISITQVPYNSLVIAYERLNVFAYVEILAAVLKLAIVLMLVFLPGDKLIVYGILTLSVSVIIAMIYRIYCIRNLKESSLHWIWNKEILKPMLTFSGWDLYGNGCMIAKQQGFSFLINMFFGVALNAGASIANVVTGNISAFITNITMAIRPQILKQYAAENYARVQSLMKQTIIFGTVLQSCFAIPFCLEAGYVLHLWLGVVPPYAESFSQIMLLTSIIGFANGVLIIAIHAQGNIKFLSFINGSISLLTLPVLWIMFRHGADANWAYWIGVFSIGVMTSSSLLIIKYLCNKISTAQFIIAQLKTLALVAISAIAIFFLRDLFQPSFIRLIIITSSYIILIGSATYLFMLSPEYKTLLKERLLHKIAK